MELAPLTVLNKTYSIKRTLGDPGPFDIKYLGQDVNTKEQVIIREYFPTMLAKRESGKTSIEVTADDEEDSLFESGLAYFRKESEVLAGLSHEALPANVNVFDANGTVYRARPHQASMSLAKGLENKGQLPEKAALMIMIPILGALHEAHEAGLYHGGVSPHTVRLLEGGDVLLTGFRGAQIQVARKADQLDALRQPGFSAIEQYTPRANQGPWTDVYGAAATVCRMITGQAIPQASERLEGDDPLEELLANADISLSPGVRETLLEALVVDPSKRLQSIDALRKALEESSERYDSSEATYAIIPVDSSDGQMVEVEDAEDEDDEEIEVLTTAGGGDRPARARRQPEDDSGIPKAALFGVPLLLLALGGVWFFTGGEEGGSYADYRATADSLFAEAEYDQAESFYNQALQARPEDEYVLDRLSSISERQEQTDEARYREQMERGEELLERANNFAERNNYEEANTTYGQASVAFYTAQDLQPESEEAQAMISEVEERQSEVLSELYGGGDDGGNIQDQLYENFITQADQRFNEGNWAAAQRHYENALDYRDDDPYATEQLDLVAERMAEQSEAEQFRQHLERGERLMETGRYADAQEAFEQAVQLNPDDGELQALMSENEELLAEQQQRRDQLDELRANADEAFQEGNYEEAVALYQEAYNIDPDDDTVANRLQQAQREYEEVQMAEQRRQREEQRREEDETTGDRVYTVTDQDPAPVGGLRALTEQASYPSRAARRGVEGRVYIQATVNADGTVREAEVLRGIGYGADDEALRVVRQAEFEPAQVSGRPVAARTTVWVQFSLGEE